MAADIKHLIDWKYWDDNEIVEIFELARRVKYNRWEYQSHMHGNTLVMIFQKTSTRTRVSFEAGMTEMLGLGTQIQDLGNQIQDLDKDESRVNPG